MHKIQLKDTRRGQVKTKLGAILATLLDKDNKDIVMWFRKEELKKLEVQEKKRKLGGDLDINDLLINIETNEERLKKYKNLIAAGYRRDEAEEIVVSPL